jgi:hypothetical protein
MSVNLNHAIWRHIVAESTRHNHRCEDLKHQNKKYGSCWTYNVYLKICFLYCGCLIIEGNILCVHTLQCPRCFSECLFFFFSRPSGVSLVSEFALKLWICRTERKSLDGRSAHRKTLTYTWQHSIQKQRHSPIPRAEFEAVTIIFVMSKTGTYALILIDAHFPFGFRAVRLCQCSAPKNQVFIELT